MLLALTFTHFAAGIGLLLAAYLAGSIPFSLLIARWAGGIDLRKHGSGNVGATNVARTLGFKWGLVALLLDALKGLLPTWVLPLLLFGPNSTHAPVAAGLAAIVGHMFPCWLGFKGGKGVATALGVVGILSWQATLAAFVVFALTFALSRIVSLSSILAALTFAVAEMVLLWPEAFSAANWSRGAFALAIPALIIHRHRSNIVRLLKGEEHRFTRKTQDQA
ncbi:MAG: glycerol-3-phosphate 1-O-acyltransferase PlsY [Planctomycetaceae bacterium]|nr:glycerol-3-phosphate 1-O-acyltransferase PlsY [Planctomycetaceae bacterium]